MYQEKVNIEQGIRPTGELLTDRSFLMPKTTKSDKNEQPEIMKDQEELRKGSLVFLAKEQIPVQEADNDDTAEDIADGGRDQIVEDKGSDI